MWLVILPLTVTLPTDYKIIAPTMNKCTTGNLRLFVINPKAYKLICTNLQQSYRHLVCFRCQVNSVTTLQHTNKIWTTSDNEIFAFSARAMTRLLLLVSSMVRTGMDDTKSPGGIRLVSQFLSLIKCAYPVASCSTVNKRIPLLILYWNLIEIGRRVHECDE